MGKMVTGFYFLVFLFALFMTGSFLIRNKKVDSVYLFFSILVTINCFGRYMQAEAESVEMAIWANKLLYVGGCYAPLLTVQVLGKLCGIKMPKSLSAFLVLYSTVIMGLVFTIGHSTIYYKHVELVIGDGYHYLDKTYGPLHILYPVMMGLYAMIMIIYLLIALRKRKEISFQLVVTICATAFSIFFMYILERITESNVSFLSVGYLVGIVFLDKYFERINMYDMSVNISVSAERMNHYGYIVFDNKFRYVNANQYIKELFPEMKLWSVDKEVCASDSYLYKECIQYLKEWNGEESGHKYINVDDKYYQFDIRRISYRKKAFIGYLLEFIDRTLEKEYYNTIEKYNTVMEKKVEEKTKEVKQQEMRTKQLFIQTVTALSEAVDAKDRYTSGHSKRVAEYSRMIAERLGKSKEEQDEIYRAGLLHDVGKIRIPAEIINKPGKLTEEEYNIIKIHSITGYHILRGISDSSDIAVAAKYHHERYDGKGYPNGLDGKNIPEVARILAIADAYDAMASNRSYRKALPQEVVRSEIEKGKNSQFDPYIAEIMLRMIEEDEGYLMREIDSRKRKILTVDDEVINNKIITHIMSDESRYEVVSASSGKEALDVLQHQAFDLILLDVKMPELDGLETLKLIREKYRTPVVLMTSEKTLDLSLGFSEYGCDDYITKPFLPLLVKEVVHNMTERTNIEKHV
ncbi:MAG: response regulator [Lachnospiraceae bacterium]|nr:response regulator [Lachnospiraceae bacterium]